MITLEKKLPLPGYIARMKVGQILSISTKDYNANTIRNAVCRAKHKIPGSLFKTTSRDLPGEVRVIRLK